jgi:hypothetical protein
LPADNCSLEQIRRILVLPYFSFLSFSQHPGLVAPTTERFPECPEILTERNPCPRSDFAELSKELVASLLETQMLYNRFETIQAIFDQIGLDFLLLMRKSFIIN